MYKSENKQECLAQNIRLFCTTNGLTNRDFMGLVGVSEATLNNWLRGSCLPDETSQHVLEKVFNAKFDKICSNIITARFLLDRVVTIEDVFPYNCIISASFGVSSGTDALLRYEYSNDDDFDFNYRKISPEVFDQIFGTLNYREQMIIEMRYRDSYTLEDVGKKVGVTRERVRQIEYKALRKINFGVEKFIRKTRLDLEELQAENAQLRQYIAALEAAKSIDTSAPAAARPAVLPAALDTCIEDLDFSVRTYNCLKRAQINTIQDIVNYTAGFERIRNLGRRSIDEIASKISGLHVGYVYDIDQRKFVLDAPYDLPPYEV